MILLLLLSLLFNQSTQLSGQSVASFCHCDLTTSLCDPSCCCDPDCTSSPSTACYNSKSNSYCPDPTFFARMGSTYLNPQGCFYYNSTNTILEEVSLTSQEVNSIVNQQTSFSRLANNHAPVHSGYQMGDILPIQGNNNFSFVDTSGICLYSTGTVSFQLKFGLNIRLSCANSSEATPLLFSTFSGKSLNQFSGDSLSNITLPLFSSTSITSVSLTILVGYYGSNKAYYLQRATATTSTVSSPTRILSISFVFPSELQQPSSAPSFFPQLPSDIFYPVYLLS